MYRHVLHTCRLENVLNHTGFVSAHRYKQSELYWHSWLRAGPAGACGKVQARVRSAKTLMYNIMHTYVHIQNVWHHTRAKYIGMCVMRA